MATALWPLQVAVMSALKADATLATLAHGVYDNVPTDATRPYVTLGSVTQSEADAHNQTGIDAIVVLHIWSDYAGNKEAAEILDAICNVLDRKPLNVTGWTHVSVAMTTADTIPDSDPTIRHINAAFRAWLTKE